MKIMRMKRDKKDKEIGGEMSGTQEQINDDWKVFCAGKSFY